MCFKSELMFNIIIYLMIPNLNWMMDQNYDKNNKYKWFSETKIMYIQLLLKKVMFTKCE